jgi:hypothetical protein
MIEARNVVHAWGCAACERSILDAVERRRSTTRSSAKSTALICTGRSHRTIAGTATVTLCARPSMKVGLLWPEPRRATSSSRWTARLPLACRRVWFGGGGVEFGCPGGERQRQSAGGGHPCGGGALAAPPCVPAQIKIHYMVGVGLLGEVLRADLSHD